MIDLDELLAAYPALRSLSATRLAERAAHLPLVRVESGARVFSEGNACAGFPFVVGGQVRVARTSPHGRELELYRLGPGDICVVSGACLFGGAPMTAHAQAAKATRFVLVDRETLLEWTDARPFREFLYARMAGRIATLGMLAESVAFQRLDRRLARRLLAGGNSLQITHQRLADELGTAREIVSRWLGRLEERGLVRLGRERIELLDRAALGNLADDL